MFIIPGILVVLNIILIVSYYFNVIDRRNATTTTEKLRDEMREIDRKLIYEYWNSQNQDSKNE